MASVLFFRRNFARESAGGTRWSPSLGQERDCSSSWAGTELSGMVRRTVADVARLNVAGPEDLEALGSAVQ